jgi:hypothetical protein
LRVERGVCLLSSKRTGAFVGTSSLVLPESEHNRHAYDSSNGITQAEELARFREDCPRCTGTALGIHGPSDAREAWTNSGWGRHQVAEAYRELDELD